MANDVFCENCGKRMEKGARFCVYCGTESERTDLVREDRMEKVAGNEKAKMKNKKGFIILIVMVFTIVFAVLICISIYNAPAKRLARALDLGQKYLLDENYNQAIVEFNKVIEIDPQNVDAYLGLAEVYEKIGDEEAVREILEKGYEITHDDRILIQMKRMGYMRETVKPDSLIKKPDVAETVVEETEPVVQMTDEAAYMAYEVVLDQYKKACAVDTEEWSNNRRKYRQQFADLNLTILDEYHTPSHYTEEFGDEPYILNYGFRDIDGNGIPELIFECYQHEPRVFEIYAFNGIEAVKLGLADYDKYESYDAYTNGIIEVYKIENVSYYEMGSDGYTVNEILLSEDKKM